MREQLVWILALSLAAPAVAAAQEQKSVDPVVITATKVATPSEQIGASISVVNGDDFQTYHYPTVDEALRNVPGVEIRRSGSYGKTSSITIRGANANQVQVLVDGVRVKSPTLGQVDLSDLSPDLIERIEIIRGAQSTLYGADAIGGVVNIITRKGTGGPFQASVQQEVGNYDTLASRATVDRGLEDPELRAVGLALREQRPVPERRHQRQCAERARRRHAAVELLARLHLPLQQERHRGAGEGGLPGPAADRPDHQPERQAAVGDHHLQPGGQDPAGGVVGDPGPSLPLREQPGLPGPGRPRVSFDFPVFSQVDVVRKEAEWDNSFFIGKWSTSTVGLEYRREEGENKGVFRTATETKSVFFEQQLRFFDRLFITGGFRVEDNSVFGTTTTERGSVAFVIKETGTRLHGSAGTGFRAPTFNDLFFPDFGNPNLQPEKSLSYDFGVDQKLWKNRIRLGLTYFQNNYTNLITCCVSIPTAPFGGPVNVGRARSAGIEFTSEVDVLPNLVALAQLHVHRLREPRHRPAAAAGATAPLEHRPHLGADRAAVAVHPGPRGERAVRALRRGVQQRLHAGGRRRAPGVSSTAWDGSGSSS